MHSHTIQTAKDGTWYANLNGDFSGDVRLVTPLGMQAYFPERCDWAGEERWELKIPFEVMKELVGVYLGSEAISRIEQMTGREYIDSVHRTDS